MTVHIGVTLPSIDLLPNFFRSTKLSEPEHLYVHVSGCDLSIRIDKGCPKDCAIIVSEDGKTLVTGINRPLPIPYGEPICPDVNVDSVNANSVTAL